MSKFNLKDYQKTNGDEHITMRLEKEHSDAADVVNERQLEDGRVDEKGVTIEKLLADNRTGAEDEITEKRLDTHKAMFKNKYRNSETFEGDINKLEEKRLNGERTEDEKYEAASETSKQMRWWEDVKSPDGLKLANNAKKVVTAQEEDIPADADVAQELKFDKPRWTDVDEAEDPFDIVEKNPLDNLTEVDAVTPDSEEGFDVKSVPAEATPTGSMTILKQKDLPNKDLPNASGIYMVLAYDVEQFGGNADAIKNAAYEKVISARPELEDVISPDSFSDIQESSTGGMIKLRVAGYDIYDMFKQKGEFGNVSEAPSALGKDIEVTEGDFDEVTYKEKDIGGTKMAIGKLITDKAINPDNRDAVLGDAIKFITDKHPGIDVDVNSLDLTKLDIGEISFMVSAPMPQEESSGNQSAGEAMADVVEELSGDSPVPGSAEVDEEIIEEDAEEEGEITDEEIEKIKQDYVNDYVVPDHLKGPYEEDTVASSDFDIKYVKAQSDTKKK